MELFMSNKVFRNFEEFVSLTRPLDIHQRKILIESLPKTERDALLLHWKSEGWEDLFVRNEIDKIINNIRKEFDEDLILIRIQIKDGNIRKVRKVFWNKICSLLDKYSEEQKAYALEGIEFEVLDDEWILLVPYKKKG